jgi:catechol 2,3-dioxygenase-like lactoylglutathione lyase family enzyme
VRRRSTATKAPRFGRVNTIVGDVESSELQLASVYETVLYSSDVAAAARFYSEVLKLRPLEEPDELSAAFRLDDGGVLLIFDPARASTPGRPVPSHGRRGWGTSPSQWAQEASRPSRPSFARAESRSSARSHGTRVAAHCTCGTPAATPSSLSRARPGRRIRATGRASKQRPRPSDRRSSSI